MLTKMENLRKVTIIVHTFYMQKNLLLAKIVEPKELNDIGFDWGKGPKGPRDPELWDKMFARLVEYWQKNGSFSVPQT